MNPRRPPHPFGHGGAEHAAGPQAGKRQPPRAPGVAQPKPAASQAKMLPPAPTRPRPNPATKTAQPAAVNTGQGHSHPAAPPPIHRPQPAPKVLQAKAAVVRQPGRPPRPPAAPHRPSAVQAKLSGTIQAAFSVTGAAARNRVNAITGGNNGFDPFGGFTFAQWHPNGARIGFDNAIVAHVVANAPHDNLGPPNWYTCAYCNWEYPLNRMQVDHTIPWAQYSAQMTTAGNINAARAWEVYVGCNDPANLTLACDSCNASKGQTAPTAAWILNRQNLANAQNGF